MNTRHSHIFFNFSKVIQQFVWLFTYFVRVVNLKLFLIRFSFLQYNFMVANPTKLVNQHCCKFEILKKISICLKFIYQNTLLYYSSVIHFLFVIFYLIDHFCAFITKAMLLKVLINGVPQKIKMDKDTLLKKIKKTH